MVAQTRELHMQMGELLSSVILRVKTSWASPFVRLMST